jgi:hypothetical protein
MDKNFLALLTLRKRFIILAWKEEECVLFPLSPRERELGRCRRSAK